MLQLFALTWFLQMANFFFSSANGRFKLTDIRHASRLKHAKCWMVANLICVVCTIFYSIVLAHYFQGCVVFASIRVIQLVLIMFQLFYVQPPQHTTNQNKYTVWQIYRLYRDDICQFSCVGYCTLYYLCVPNLLYRYFEYENRIQAQVYVKFVDKTHTQTHRNMQPDK